MTELSEIFSACLKGSVTVLGIGNRLRGDDGAGSLLAERLARRIGPTVLDCGEVPENYTDRVKEQVPRAVVLVDTVQLGSEPGALAAFRGGDLSGPGRPSTHNPSLGLLALYLAAETGAEVFLLGIQPKHTGFGEPMSEEVSHTVEILEELLAFCLHDTGSLPTGEENLVAQTFRSAWGGQEPGHVATSEAGLKPCATLLGATEVREE